MHQLLLIFFSAIFFMSCSTKATNEKSEAMTLMGDSLSPYEKNEIREEKKLPGRLLRARLKQKTTD